MMDGTVPTIPPFLLFADNGWPDDKKSQTRNVKASQKARKAGSWVCSLRSTGGTGGNCGELGGISGGAGGSEYRAVQVQQYCSDGLSEISENASAKPSF